VVGRARVPPLQGDVDLAQHGHGLIVCTQDADWGAAGSRPFLFLPLTVRERVQAPSRSAAPARDRAC
jgi:hypothetical protein